MNTKFNLSQTPRAGPDRHLSHIDPAADGAAPPRTQWPRSRPSQGARGRGSPGQWVRPPSGGKAPQATQGGYIFFGSQVAICGKNHSSSTMAHIRKKKGSVTRAM
ncbi:hypothetical protein MASR1M50_30030 [Burkholderiales bacterium]